MVTTEYQRWNTRFSSPDYVFGTAPNAFLAAQAHRLKRGQSVLAVADGEGRNGVHLARQGLDVLSIDFSPAAQDKARRLAATHNATLRFELADLTQWRWEPERFDAVVAIFTQFLDPAQRAAAFAGMKSTLKRGGLLLLQGYRPKQLEYKTGGPPILENLYTSEMLRNAFGDLRIVLLAEHDSEIHEGTGHGGMSALIDLVAAKP
jgi:cyclopropane fatty-acyl-phospholipid synthase-like methyltransferase